MRDCAHHRTDCCGGGEGGSLLQFSGYGRHSRAPCARCLLLASRCCCSASGTCVFVKEWQEDGNPDNLVKSHWHKRGRCQRHRKIQKSEKWARQHNLQAGSQFCVQGPCAPFTHSLARRGLRSSRATTTIAAQEIGRLASVRARKLPQRHDPTRFVCRRVFASEKVLANVKSHFDSEPAMQQGCSPRDSIVGWKLINNCYKRGDDKSWFSHHPKSWVMQQVWVNVIHGPMLETLVQHPIAEQQFVQSSNFFSSSTHAVGFDVSNNFLFGS